MRVTAAELMEGDVTQFGTVVSVVSEGRRNSYVHVRFLLDEDEEVRIFTKFQQITVYTEERGE